MFIPIAEEHHLIVPLTRYVMAETIRQRHVFPMSSQFHVGINVAPSHFRRGVADKRSQSVLVLALTPIQQLILEITERDALLDVDYRIARELHRKNVKLAIDDFGTGNSSFSWLETLRPDVLKIDKSFTAAIGSDAVNSTVTDIIIALGQRLNIELVAEGVETQEQAKYFAPSWRAYFARVFVRTGRCRYVIFPNGWRAANRRPPGIMDISRPLCRYVNAYSSSSCAGCSLTMRTRSTR
ncbi:putative signal transduction protein [Escherichia coli]|uniref:Putative signal transduction protein n=1 Tax=Escherichia coli TaxID=562 RepID=A0A376KUP8_ECOLX|nr:putative signal transduction protein [Escherichia coli]